MAVLHAQRLASVEGATRFSAHADWPHPWVAVFGSVHGNEPCGLAALRRIAHALESSALTLRDGTLVLVHGNPRASERGTRACDAHVDLNRLFDFRFVEELPRQLWTYEHQRALELRPLLEASDGAIDLHSTTRSTPPFAIATCVPASEPLAAALGLEYLTLGWDGPGLLGDRVLFAPLTRRGLPAVAVECGRHDDPGAVDVAFRSAVHGLAHLGVLAAQAARKAPKRLTVRDAIKRPSQTFAFSPAIVGMQLLAAGDEIGRDENLVLTARRRCFAVMPNDAVPVGDDMLYLAVEENDETTAKALP